MLTETNNQSAICPYCYNQVPAESYFCPNCGKALKTKPPATAIAKQIVVYLVCLFLPPFGLWYAWKYLKQEDKKSKEIGLVAVVLTIVSIILTVWLTNLLLNSVNQSLNRINGLTF